MRQNEAHRTVVIAVHDACEEAAAEVVDHVLDSLALAGPRRHDAVLGGGYAHRHRSPAVQRKLCSTCASVTKVRDCTDEDVFFPRGAYLGFAVKHLQSIMHSLIYESTHFPVLLVF